MELRDSTLGDLLTAIAARQPTPGGGAVASIAGALGAALAQMAGRYSLRKSTPSADRQAVESALDDLQSLADRFLDLAQADALAYGRLNTLQRLDEDDPERKAAWTDAVRAAVEAPMSVATAAATALESFDQLLPRCNRYLLSDLAIAAILADSAARCAAWNVQINLPLTDGQDRDRYRTQIQELVKKATQSALRIEEVCRANADAQ